MNSTKAQQLSDWIQYGWIEYLLEDKEDLRQEIPQFPGLYCLVAESQDGQNWILLHVGQTQTNLRESWSHYLKLPMVQILHKLSLQVSLAVFPLPEEGLSGLSLEQLAQWEKDLIEALEPILTKTPAALQVAVN